MTYRLYPPRGPNEIADPWIIHADHVRIGEDGTLSLWQHQDNGVPVCIRAMAPGTWNKLIAQEAAGQGDTHGG